MDCLIRNAHIVNEGEEFFSDVLVKKGRIDKVATTISTPSYRIKEVNAEGLHLLPGVIDDQVHFREPGLTHKADIFSESRAAVAGGVTSFMDMPNTNPQTITQAALEDKFRLASTKSLANYSFFMGATNDNLDELRRTDPKNVCGIKIFIGSSTGNMLVDREDALDRIFGECGNLIAIHSEDEQTIRENLEEFKARYGDDIPFSAHPLIRSVEACYKSTERAIIRAKKYGTRLHILHLSTEEELRLLDKQPLGPSKRITAEVCVHHLWYDSRDYEKLGGLIKCNPAIKEPRHKRALFEALLDGLVDIIATDHAPHTWEEKQNKYLNCPSGLPLVQHPLLMMLEFHHRGKITLPTIVKRMSHAPADCFRMVDRGYIREGYFADLVLLNLKKPHTVSKQNIYYKCGWSPLEGYEFQSSVDTTFVNGSIAYSNGSFDDSVRGDRLQFSGH